jgi:hypothetical protein
MNKREEVIAGLIETVSKKSQGFSAPPITTIGGYAMRAFVPFSRYTRDCDFVIPKENGWAIDVISRWFPEEVEIEAFEKHETYGYLRVMDILRIERKTARVSIDFMEGEVRGRTEEQVVLIDQKFIENRKSVRLNVGGKDIEMFVPDYTDFFILKVVSGRPSDIRDIAALVWKNGISDNLDKRVTEILPKPTVFGKMLKDSIIPDISDKRFVESWRGTFVTTEFDEKAKEDVLLKIKGLCSR